MRRGTLEIGEGGRADTGATLLEMLVVLAVLGLAIGIGFPRLRGVYEALDAEAARTALAADLRSARARAIREDRTVEFEVGSDGREFAWDGVRTRLPDGLRLLASRSRLLFYPDGGAADARLDLVRAAHPSLRLAVEGSTGLVRSSR